MEKIDEVVNNVKALGDKVSKLENELQQILDKIELLVREIGARQGQDLYRQIDELQHSGVENSKRILNIERDVKAVRSLVEFGDNNIKEIKQALALIYRNTDELEEKLFHEGKDM